MTETQPYSFISVSSVEDDEVIQAGVSAPDKTQESSRIEDTSKTTSSDKGQRSTISTHADAPEASDGKPSLTQAQKPTQTSARATNANPDNEPVPFAHMQKVILGVLAVFVLAFIIYYNLSVR